MNRYHRIYYFLRSLVWVWLLALLVACGTPVQVVSSLPQGEANIVLSVLLNAGIRADKSVDKEGAVTILVDADQVGLAIDLLRNRGLPRENFQGFGTVFKKESMVSSPVEERARYLHALSEELAKTLSNIDGVIVARVHLVLPEHDAFTNDSIPSSAAIFIKYQKNYNVDIFQPQIKHLIANSIPGLRPERVSVILIPGEDTSHKSKQVDKESGGEPQQLPVLILTMILVVVALAGIGFVVYARWQRRRSDPS